VQEAIQAKHYDRAVIFWETAATLLPQPDSRTHQPMLHCVKWQKAGATVEQGQWDLNSSSTAEDECFNSQI